jgi:hypothetical protein
MSRKVNTKDHRSKKNPKEAEFQQKRREEQNRSRGKQIWTDAGWSRTSVDNSASATN